jgi:hypothetical protein
VAAVQEGHKDEMAVMKARHEREMAKIRAKDTELVRTNAGLEEQLGRVSREYAIVQVVVLHHWVRDRISKATGNNLEAKAVAAGLVGQEGAAVFVDHYIKASRTTIAGMPIAEARNMLVHRPNVGKITWAISILGL